MYTAADAHTAAVGHAKQAVHARRAQSAEWGTRGCCACASALAWLCTAPDEESDEEESELESELLSLSSLPLSGLASSTMLQD